VWVGLDQPESIAPDAFGARYALPIWAEFMARTARVKAPQPFRAPTSVTRIELCRVSHLLPTELCPRYGEYFKAGDVVPDRTCDIHRGPARTVTQVLGGIFSGLGRKLGSIFGKH